MRSRWARKLWTLVALASCVGCSVLNPPPHGEQAEARWNRVRGRLKYQMAQEAFDAGQVKESHKHLEAAIREDPTSAEAYVLLTKILLEQGETAAAADALDHALELGGDSPESDYLSGLIAQRYARFDVALAWYQRAAERDQNNAHYIVACAEMLVALDQVAEALELVRSRWTDFDNNAALRSLAGGIHMLLGRYESAANAYREASQIAPDDVTLRTQLGLALAYSDQHDEGAAVLRAVVEEATSPSFTTFQALGRCQFARREFADAKQTFGRAVEVRPSDPDGWSWLSRAALELGELITARRAATRAAMLDPDDPDLALLLGYVCWRQGDHAQAVESLETALERHPDQPLTLCLLGQSYEAVGKTVAGKECYRHALRLNPELPWAEQLLEGRAHAPRGSDNRSPRRGDARAP